MSAKKYTGLESELYDLFRGSDDFDEIGYYVDLALNAGSNCLDVGCGTGRVLIPIAQQGIKITGLDNSNVMIEECRKRLSSEGISASLIEEDMTNFNCENNFDLIIVPGGSFQLLDDRNDALAALNNFQKVFSTENLEQSWNEITNFLKIDREPRLNTNRSHSDYKNLVSKENLSEEFLNWHKDYNKYDYKLFKEFC